MASPVEMYFPQKELDYFREMFRTISKEQPHSKRDLLDYLRAYTTVHSEASYGFLDSLTRDIYTPTKEERDAHYITMTNCTTIIPQFYQLLETKGMEPEIVQFLGFRDTKPKKKSTETPENEHFAIVVKINRKGQVKEYLTDPFYNVCGEIVEKADGYWRIKGSTDFPSVRREFQAALYYTKEEFAQMLYDLRDDGKSLDMLIAGQKIRKEFAVNKANCDLMLYYSDETNAVTTRLYIPQVGITDKAIHCAHYMNEGGNVQRQELTFSIANDQVWHYLIGERRIAVTDYKTLQHIKQLFGKKTRFEKQPRIGALLDTDEMITKKKTLLAIADTLYSQLTKEQQTALKPFIFVRTLYEAEAKDQEYVYDEEKREERIRTMLQENMTYRDQIQPLDDIILIASWNLSNTTKNDVRKAKRRKKILEDKRDASRFGALNTLRKDNNLVYHRTMDKVLFAQQYKQTAPDDLERLVEEQGLDWRLGYLALVTDFIPYAFAARKDLGLHLFMESLQRRVKARCTPH